MQQGIRSAQELMTLIEHEQRIIVNRLHSDQIEGIHEFIMEHALKSRKYYMELIVLMGREDATHKWNTILHNVYGLDDEATKSLTLMGPSTGLGSNLQPT